MQAHDSRLEEVSNTLTRSYDADSDRYSRGLLNASMLVFHLPIFRFLSYGITPWPMAGPVGLV